MIYIFIEKHEMAFITWLTCIILLRMMQATPAMQVDIRLSYSEQEKFPI